MACCQLLKEDSINYIMEKFKQIIKIIAYSLAILGTTIGAGFVSGKEIANFFNVYGNFSYIAALILGVVYFFSIKLFYKCQDLSIFTKSKVLTSIVMFSQFISLSAMFAGLNSILTNYFGTKYLFYIFIIISFVIILCGLKGLTNTNLILMPILVLFIFYIGSSAIFSNTHFDIEIISSSPTKILTYLLMYIGLDLFSCYPICLALGKKQTKKQQNITALIVSITIFALVVCYLVSVLNKGSDYAYFDMPILHFIIAHNDSLYIFTCVIVCIGIITTLLSNGFVLYDSCKNLFNKNWFVVFLSMFCGAYILSYMGFSNIVEYLYPLLGIIGLTLIILLMVFLKKAKKVQGV